ncbi:MAG TPA: pyridoxal phosphate-dependent aminotransferase [Vicinamibacterales bacterium]|nr:pyridoxal phosphate-dependent aminotransferase [Vicinamibacterales bacterium]
MGKFLDSVPVSAIVKIRDMMYTVKDPFRLDQGDVSFDAPETFKQGVAKAMADNRTHYLPSSGIPPLRKAFAEKMRKKNGIPIGSDEEVIVTNGGTHGLFAVFQAILEPGDEVIIPDPEWPPTMAIVKQAGGVPVQVPLREELGWRWDIADVEKAITPKTRVLYLNSPNNPTGGVLTREDLEKLAALARDKNLLVVSDEAYEDVVYKGEHISIASLPGMYDRTIPVYTMSKSYAITGVRVGYFAMKDPALRDRGAKVVLYSTTNVSSIAQYGAVAAMEGSQQCIADFKKELLFRRDMFFKGIQEAAPGVFSGTPPDGAFYAFLKINPEFAKNAGITGGSRAEASAKAEPSLSWAMAEFLIKNARIGCVPGVDFGPKSEGYLRFCTCRSREELTGALASMKEALASVAAR